MSGRTVLAARGVSVHAGSHPLVHEVDLAVGPGERVGLIGESGSGKTLTALAIMGLLPESLAVTGSVRLAGLDTDVIGASERVLSTARGRLASMVFQEPMTALNPTMRVGDQVAEAMLVHGTAVDRRAARRASLALLDDVKLPDPGAAARAYPHQLSGGQRQRVVLAIALANDPGLLICDEPTTALDVTVQAQVLERIVAGAARRGSGLLFITHDLPVVATVCERVAVMRQGRIVEEGPVEEVFTRPAHPYTAALLGASDLVGSLRPQRTTPRVDTSTTPVNSGNRDQPQPEGEGEGVVEVSRRPGVEVPAIEVRGVSRTYRRPRTSLTRPGATVQALSGVDLTVARGERVGIVGESGSGKSTLLRLIAALDEPTSGQVEVAGQLVSGVPERRLSALRERLQLVFQDPMGSLDPRMRVHEVVAEPLQAQGRPAHRDRVWELLESVGLEADAAARYPHEFSGGQRQRISIARALAPRPDILLADEPVSALDVTVRATVLRLLGQLVDELDLTLVLVSHDLGVVRHVCDRVVVMHQGRIVEDGPTEQVYRAPAHPYTRRLIGAIPTLGDALAGVGAAQLAARGLAAAGSERQEES